MRLKRTPRTGWKDVGVPAPESVADHAWGLSLLALVAARETGLDAGKAAQLAIVHDLAEAITGDLRPGDVDAAEKRLRENAAMAELAARLPDASRKHLLALWAEYESLGSPEARLVRELDKVEMAATARMYEDEGFPRDKLARFRESARRAVADPRLQALLLRYE